MISWANSCGREEVYYFSLSLVVYVLLLKVGLGRSAVTMFLGTIENHIVSENDVVELVACHSWDDSICIYVSCGHQSTFDFFYLRTSGKQKQIMTNISWIHALKIYFSFVIRFFVQFSFKHFFFHCEMRQKMWQRMPNAAAYFSDIQSYLH